MARVRVATTADVPALVSRRAKVSAPAAPARPAFSWPALFGAMVGWLAGSLLRIRRAHVEAALSRANIGNAREVAAQMYRRLGIALVKLLTARAESEASQVETRPEAPHSGTSQVGITPVRGPENSLIDAETLDAAVACGPVVIFASHCGNWELAAAAAAAHLRPRRLHMVAKPMHSAFFDRWLARLRARLGVRVIGPAGALAAAAGALAAGDVVAMPIDQVPDREAHGLWINFLGAPALVDRAPATVAYRARATVLVVAGGRVLDVIPPGDTRAWIAATTLRATAALERHIRTDPASWMWLHRRWKRPARLVAVARVD